MVEKSITCKECQHLIYCESEPLNSRCSHFGGGKVDPFIRHMICYGATRGKYQVMGKNGPREQTLEEKQEAVAKEHKEMEKAVIDKKKNKKLAAARNAKGGFFWDEVEECYKDTEGNVVDEYGDPVKPKPKAKTVKKKTAKKKAPKKKAPKKNVKSKAALQA